MNVITLKNISKIYYGTVRVPAVNNVSLEIKQGELFCLVGHSGCGKSTILKMIAGIEKPTAGELVFDGKIAMVFQSGALLPWRTVAQNVAFGMEMQRLSKVKIKEQTQKYLQLVDLQDLHKKYPRELSGGQKQRVGLARALAVDPNILLLDEPFSALDPVTTEEMHTYLLRIWQETHKTILMVSHLIEEAVLLADRIGVMKQGQLLKTITIDLPRPRSIQENKYLSFTQQVKKDFVL